MRAPARDPQLLKGVLPMLVIALLTERESYGYELVTRLEADGLADIAAGTVYPVLARLERDGHVASRLVASSAGPARKYYLPTELGAAELAQTVAAWRALTATVAATLGRAVPASFGAASPTPSHPEELA
ncbi:PadR family transcriptional regulator [Pengzhenrongella sicca]|uniref:PadR family transcriptional regulator n=1 Tax=Pengzhenrongella sicca TaxID=2819238 RepID=A0A8A4ZEE9_9MICO|nr:PadR family transcriptional regulator [Pengzhenrongella sicca]QTE29283.1 PadR family transcriptional regulator [Pengzhenrongella sicca]